MSETVTKQGKFERLESKSGSSNGKDWTVFNIFIDGQKYGLGFDSSPVKGLNSGDFVEFEVEKDKKGYWKLNNIKKIDPPPVSQSTPSESSTTNQYITVDRRECLKVASDLFVNYLQVSEKKLPSLEKAFVKIVALADHLVFYVTTGKLEPPTESETKLAEAVKTDSEDDDIPF